MSVLVMGVDVGSTKTGLTIFELQRGGVDALVAAHTVKVKPMQRKTAKKKKTKKKKGVVAVSTLHADMFRCWDMLAGIREFADKYDLWGIFLEMPHGGGQGARAHRLMGGATFMLTTYLQYEDIPFQAYEPGEVEAVLGIKLTAGEAKGLAKGEAAKWKKQRIEDVVRAEWPLFAGWPTPASVAEDALDSAAAFMCGRSSDLYKRLRSEVDA